MKYGKALYWILISGTMLFRSLVTLFNMSDGSNYKELSLHGWKLRLDSRSKGISLMSLI